MANVTSIGVGSGLDLENLLTDLINAERVPTEARLATREARVQANISAFGNLKSALSTLQGSLAGLRDADALRAPAATSSDPTLFTAAALSGAQAGRFSVQVLNLARAHKLASGDFGGGGSTVGSGKLTITAGAQSFDVDVAAGTTLTALRDAINGAPGNNAVTASLLTVDDGLGGGGTVTKLVLTANTTGADNAIAVTVADDDGQHTDDLGLSRFFFAAGNPQNRLSEIAAARDARISVDGFTASSSTDTFTGVLDGVTITALREPADPLAPETATLSVATDRNRIPGLVEQFVAAYNEARATIDELARFDQAGGPTGPLFGDPTLRNIESGLRRILADTVEGTEDFRSLAALGVVSERDGTLAIDSRKLNVAIQSNFEDVVNVFASADGVATRFDEALDAYLGSNGVIRTRTDGFDKQLQEIGDQREALALRVTALERRIRSQFVALDQLVARLQSTGDFLLQQLENTSKIITSRRGGD